MALWVLIVNKEGRSKINCTDQLLSDQDFILVLFCFLFFVFFLGVGECILTDIPASALHFGLRAKF